MNGKTILFIVALMATLIGSMSPIEAQPTLEWIRQFGTTEPDCARDLTTDGLGNVYVTGYTYGDLGGPNAAGTGWSPDAFLSKLDNAGALQWTCQLGTSPRDRGYGVTADGLGNSYITGWTEGNLGGANAGQADVFVSHYDADVLQWTRQFGGAKWDSGDSIVVDTLGNLYVAGTIKPNSSPDYAFLRRYDTSGSLLWNRELGPSYDLISLAMDGLGNVFIGGKSGQLGTPIGWFVSKFNSNGTLQWQRQSNVGSWEQVYDVAADGLGNVYFSGYGTVGDEPDGAFLAKFDADGTLIWTRSQTGTDVATQVVVDGLGGVYTTWRTLLSDYPDRLFDVHLSKYDDAGTELWTEHLPSLQNDTYLGPYLAADALGNIWLSEITFGDLGGANAGREDIYVAKFVDRPVPEPASIWLVALIVLAFSLARTTRHMKRNQGFIKTKSMTNAATLLVAALSTTSICCVSLAQAQPTLEWVQQYGVSGWDAVNDVAVDPSGDVYIVGGTGASVSSFYFDAFVRKYDPSGVLLWMQELGTDESEKSEGVSVDGSGNVYVAGFTKGDLAGTNAGSWDAFLSKFNSSGALEWSRQWGTSVSDSASKVSVDDLGNVYVSGSTRGSLHGANNGGSDALLTKYDASGVLQWTRQFGGVLDDASRDVAVDGLGNVYVAGYIGDDPDTQWNDGNACLAKYDASGAQQWMRQLSDGEGNSASGVSMDGLGNVYLVGTTIWDWVHYDFDPFVAKYDAEGELQWRQVQHTSEPVGGSDISADGWGNIYITGRSQDDPSASDVDAYLRKYDASGAYQWSQLLGTSSFERAYGVATNGTGEIYIAGFTEGSLGGPNAGGNPAWDAFLAKFVDRPVPEPSAGLLIVLGTVWLALGDTRRRRP